MAITWPLGDTKFLLSVEKYFIIAEHSRTEKVIFGVNKQPCNDLP